MHHRANVCFTTLLILLSCVSFNYAMANKKSDHWRPQMNTQSKTKSNSVVCSAKWPTQLAYEANCISSEFLGKNAPKSYKSFKSPKLSKVKRLPNQRTIILPKHISGLYTATNAIHYNIIVGPGPNKLVVKGNPLTVAALNYKVKNGQLRLYFNNAVDKGYLHRLLHPRNPQYRLSVYLHLSRLNTLSQHGQSSIHLQYKKPQTLSIDKSGSGSLMIKGNAIRLVQFNNTGSGKVVINRIYSTRLVVNDTGNATIKLYGSRINLVGLNEENSKGNLFINYIRSKSLFVNVQTSGTTTLDGIMNVANINFSGSGSLRMLWVKSKRLNVSTYGTGNLSLAGIAETVNAYAHERSHLNLRYLKANDVYVTTYHTASADVWANDDLYALAENNSNIYYYNKPKYTSRFMRQSGTILPMTTIPSAVLSFNSQGGFR